MLEANWCGQGLSYEVHARRDGGAQKDEDGGSVQKAERMDTNESQYELNKNQREQSQYKKPQIVPTSILRTLAHVLYYTKEQT